MYHTDTGFPLQITGGTYKGLPGPTKENRKNPFYQTLQGPAVHHGRLTEIGTLCPGVRTGRLGTLTRAASSPMRINQVYYTLRQLLYSAGVRDRMIIAFHRCLPRWKIWEFSWRRRELMSVFPNVPSGRQGPGVLYRGTAPKFCMFHKRDLLPLPLVEHTKLRSCTSVVPSVPGRVGKDGRARRPSSIMTAVLCDGRALQSFCERNLPVGPERLLQGPAVICRGSANYL